MKVLFLLLFAAAALITAWRVTPPKRRRKIMLRVSRARTAVADLARALQEKAQRKRYAFRRAFLDQRGYLHADGEAMMAHLSQYCYAFTTTAHGKVSTEELLRREGRRQVWIEIMGQLGLEPADALHATQNQQVLA